MPSDKLPHPEIISPDDLIRFADGKLRQVQAAIAHQDSAAVIGHINELAAGGAAELADRLNGGLVEIGLRNLAKAAPFEDEDDERRRWRFLSLAAVRPDYPEPGRWSAGQERVYLILRAGVFHAYIETCRYTDPTLAVLYRKAADLTAHELIAWDLRHDSRLGPFSPLHPEFADASHVYVAQEILAFENF